MYVHIVSVVDLRCFFLVLITPSKRCYVRSNVEFQNAAELQNAEQQYTEK
jgi:hypothetical protein